MRTTLAPTHLYRPDRPIECIFPVRKAHAKEKNFHKQRAERVCGRAQAAFRLFNGRPHTIEILCAVHF